MLDHPDADGVPCPECGIPFGEKPSDDMPVCWYCGAGEGKPSPPLPLPDPPSTGDDDYCCEDHLPSRAMTYQERLEHVCPACGWSPSDVPERTDG